MSWLKAQGKLNQSSSEEEIRKFGLARITERSRCDPLTGCHVWFGDFYSCGYGRISFRGKSTNAHRVAWILTKGRLPQGVFVLHRCDNRACVNVEHLFLGSQRDNIIDMYKKGRGARGEKNGQAKINSEQVKQIRERTISGESQRSLANKFGISKTSIARVVHRITWANV